MRYSLQIKKAAISLRRSGLSIDRIAERLGIAKTTAYLWTKSVKISDRAKKRLARNSVRGRADGLRKMALGREQLQTARKDDAERLVKKILSRADKDYWQMLAAIFFWCEGGKRHLTSLQFANSDPQLISTFLTFLRLGFVLYEPKFRALVHLHGYHNEQQQIIYWSKITKIPINQFLKSYRKPNTAIRVRDGYPGCVSVRYNDAAVARKLDAIYHVLALNMGVW